VKVLAGPAERYSGVRLTSVEIYEDRVRVNCQVLAPAEPASLGRPDRGAQFARLVLDRDPVERFGLTDDAGTAYHGRSVPPLRAGWPQHARASWGAGEFIPAPPPAATELAVRWREHVWAIGLGERPA
jgi:hypothetical protein